MKRKLLQVFSATLFMASLKAPAASPAPPADCSQQLIAEKIEQWKPANADPNNRWGKDAAAVPNPGPPDLPGYLKATNSDGSTGYVRQGVVFGPNESFQAAFNPAAWTAIDAQGRGKKFLLIRGEEERPSSEWKRLSLPYLASGYGTQLNLERQGPVFTPTEPFEIKGGVEDPKFFDMSLQPYRDPKDGKTFDSAIPYVAYDGKTARIAVVFFNKGNLKEFRKGGLVFRPEDVRKNPIVPDNPEWNKSPGMIQYLDPKSGRIRNVVYAGEGNQNHGGIMAMESDAPFGWVWPPDKKPVIVARKGTYTDRLVEIAFPPKIGPLKPELALRTGQTRGIYVHLHGDSRPRGYQVGYAIFSLDDPTGPPIYESTSPFFWPVEPYEKEGQVNLVVFVSGEVETTGPDSITRSTIFYGGADRVVGAATAEMQK